MRYIRGFLAALLCNCLCLPAPMAGAQPLDPPAAASEVRTARTGGSLQGDARILQALNRFTFGPRPGDVEAVRDMGLDAWFESQLHPQTLDETGLNARLAQFPALQWNTPDLLFRLPSNAVIRQVTAGKLIMPEHGVLHAVYENQIYRYNFKKSEAGAKGTTTAGNAPQQKRRAPESPAMNPDNAEMSMDGGRTMDDNAAMKRPRQPVDDNASAVGSTLADNVLALPPQQRIAQLQAMKPAAFESFIKSLTPAQRKALTADMAPGLKEAVQALQNPEQLVGSELLAERLTRDIYSNAQLQEVMTDFWLNHFNIYIRKSQEMPYYLVSYARDTIRPHALGKFEDLLEAVAHSPAMMLYLDNATSTGPDSAAATQSGNPGLGFRRTAPNQQRPGSMGLNENYGRELMELHTLGVNGGYTQADVIQAARVLTGWTVDRPQLGGGFLFAPSRHEPGAKVVMGMRFKDGGENEGRELLHMLAMQPATAQFLSRKLAVRFVSDNPPQALVDRMAKSYLASGGDIPTVLRTLFHSPEMWSTANYRNKIKTPEDFVVSAARASNAQIDNFQPLIYALRQMGMPLYGCMPPTGWDWQSSTWVSTSALVDRMNFALSLASNRLQGVTTTWAQQAAQDDAALPSPNEEEARLEQWLLPDGVSGTTRAAALKQFAAQNSAGVRTVSATMQPSRRARTTSSLERQDQLLAGLLLGSPEFQRR